MRSISRQRGFIGIGGAILGGSILGGIGSAAAAHQQRKAAENASGQQREMFEETRADLAPWKDAGQISLQELMKRMGLEGQGGENFGQLTHQFGLEDFQASPAYQFNLEQGKLALDKSSAARGKFYAPSTLQDIAKYSQGLASNEYQNAFSNYNSNMQNIFNRLYSISGSGQNAAAQTGAFGTNAASQIGQNIMGAGNASAAGIIGGTNALTGGLNNYAQYQMLQQAMGKNQQSSLGGLDLSGVEGN